MFDNKAADFLQTRQSDDVTFTAGDRITSMAGVRTSERRPASQTLHSASHTVVARPPPPCKAYAVCVNVAW